MKRYEDYKSDKRRRDLTDDDFKKIRWTEYKIVVPTEEDRQELMEVFKHFHDEGFDSEFITANQLAHLYHDDEGKMIIVDKNLYNSIK